MKRIGKISNYYGGLFIKKEYDKYFWCIENYDGEDWEEISKELYNNLKKHGK